MFILSLFFLKNIANRYYLKVVDNNNAAFKLHYVNKYADSHERSSMATRVLVHHDNYSDYCIITRR